MTFYHGTNVDLAIGDILVPGVQLGGSTNHGRSEHVYMTWDGFTEDANEGYRVALTEALAWARTACMVAEDEQGAEDPEAFVYIVEPLGEVLSDDSGDEQVGDEARRTSSARIIGVVDSYDLELYLPKPCYGATYLSV
jgi:hypothetical protein